MALGYGDKEVERFGDNSTKFSCVLFALGRTSSSHVATSETGERAAITLSTTVFKSAINCN